MSSSSDQSTASSQQQQQQQTPRKPPLSDWPTIKILTPHQGRFSPKTDEWCFTLCTQSVGGRIHGKEPACRYMCVRKVFPHEVRNVLSFKQHQDVGPDGKAKYLLPEEGQPSKLPRILGGIPKDSDDDEPKPPPPPKHWDEGWYLSAGNGKWVVLERTEMMMLDLKQQKKLEAMRQSRKEVWQDYQDKLKESVGGDQAGTPPPAWWGPLVRPNPSTPDQNSSSILVPLPPDVHPLLDGVKKLLAPSHQVLGIFRDSIKSGEQRQFAERLWEKAKTDEPFILAQRTCSYVYELWKNRLDTEEDDEKKGST